MEGELKNLIKVWLIVLASLCYTYFIASKIPKGKLRFLSLIPIFFLFTILPLSLTTVLPTGITAFFITWLANFKLILFSFGLGPLSSDPPKSLPLIISIACFPIKIKQNDNYPSHQNTLTQKHIKSSPILKAPPKLPLNFPTKVLLFALLVAAIDYKHVHPKIVLGSYCCLLYFLVDIVLGLCNAIVRATLGIELELPSDEPYFSTSLQDFWGRRWNLMVTNILRHTIYKPIRSISATVLVKQQKQKWAPLPAVLAAFIVSGLMHELIFFYVTRVNPTWEVTCFFVLHGVCLVVELWVKNVLLARGCWWHWAVAGPLTIGFVVVTANWLFLPPLVRNGADIKAIEECKVVIKLLKDKMLWTLKSL